MTLPQIGILVVCLATLAMMIQVIRWTDEARRNVLDTRAALKRANELEQGAARKAFGPREATPLANVLKRSDTQGGDLR